MFYNLCWKSRLKINTQISGGCHHQDNLIKFITKLNLFIERGDTSLI